MKLYRHVISLEIVLGVVFLALLFAFTVSRNEYLEWFHPLLLPVVAVLLCGLTFIGAIVTDDPTVPSEFADKPPEKYLAYRYKFAGAYFVATALASLITSSLTVALVFALIGMLLLYISRNSEQ